MAEEVPLFVTHLGVISTQEVWAFNTLRDLIFDFREMIFSLHKPTFLGLEFGSVICHLMASLESS